MIPPIGPTRADMIAAENARLRVELVTALAELTTAREEVERARAALRYYARGDHYSPATPDDAEYVIDRGERAREALGEEADHG